MMENLKNLNQNEIENMNDIILDSLPPPTPLLKPRVDVDDKNATNNTTNQFNGDSTELPTKLRLKYVNSIIRMKDSNQIICNPDVCIRF
jgi:hypothetical protein